jgi:hypothetical protein
MIGPCRSVLLASLRPGGRNVERACKWTPVNVPEYRAGSFSRTGVIVQSYATTSTASLPRRTIYLAPCVRASFCLCSHLCLRMTRNYEIRSGSRTVSVQSSCSALQAAVDYVRSFGSREDEITRLGSDSVSWRGARFVAVPVAEPPTSDH